jgi:multidrug efflux pump subunit AcrA (membrane-fusion protein)
MNRPPRIRLPKRRKNPQGKPRRVGVELEMIGLDLNDIAEIVAEHKRLSITTDGRYRRILSGDDAGDWIVELDFDLLKRLGQEERGDEDLLDELLESAEELLKLLAEIVVPMELVSPPLPMPRLGEVEAELAETRSRLQGRLVQTFKYARTSSADLVIRGTVGALDLHEMAVHMHTVARITDDDRNLITAMEALAAEQRDLIAQATAARVAAVEARDTATRQRDRTAVLEAEQRSVVSAIDADRRRRQEVFDRLEADKDALAALASALTEQIRRLELANLSVLMPVGGMFVGVPDWAGRLPTSGQPYSALIASAAATQGVDGRLLAALTWSESAFRPNAVSRVGAAGMTQLMPGTARGLGLRVDGSVEQRVAIKLPGRSLLSPGEQRRLSEHRRRALGAECRRGPRDHEPRGERACGERSTSRTDDPGEHRDRLGLDLDHSAGDVEEQLFALRSLHAHAAGLEGGEERRVVRRDADIAELRRRINHRGGTGEDFALGADDVDVDRAHYCSFLAFSTASSIVPTM